MADSAPIVLYFDLEDGAAPDLEVIARATLAWNDLIREVVAVTDPGADIRVEFLSGTIGSRSINSILTAAWKVATKDPWTAGPLAAIATVFLMAPVTHAADDLTKHLARSVFGHEDDELSDHDVDRVAHAVVKLQRDQLAAESRREVYRQANREPAVKGVASSLVLGERPRLIVPRSEFSARIGGDETVQTETKERTTWKRDYPVTIVRPYSKAEERRWRFESGGEEFSATMRDPDFLASIKSGHTGIEIGEGVEIRIDLRIKEDLIGGVWHVKEQDVMRVIHPANRQRSLEFATNGPNEANP